MLLLGEAHSESYWETHETEHPIRLPSANSLGGIPNDLSAGNRKVQSRNGFMNAIENSLTVVVIFLI